MPTFRAGFADDELNGGPLSTRQQPGFRKHIKQAYAVDVGRLTLAADLAQKVRIWILDGGDAYALLPMNFWDGDALVKKCQQRQQFKNPRITNLWACS